MLGNFATGVSILAPAGMLTVLADGLGVGIRDTGLLVTFGAVILCFGSPLVAWLTTRIDRRLLLAGTLAVLVAGQAASALAPNYAAVLALRLAMLAVAAIYTPQAASTVAHDRAGEQAVERHRLRVSRLVAGGRRRPADDRFRRRLRRLARGLCRRGARGAGAVPAACLYAAARPARAAFVAQELRRHRAPPQNPAAAADHDFADLGPVHGVHLSGAAVDAADRRRSRHGRRDVRDLRRRRLCRQRHRHAHRVGARRLGHLGGVSRLRPSPACCCGRSAPACCR